MLETILFLNIQVEQGLETACPYLSVRFYTCNPPHLTMKQPLRLHVKVQVLWGSFTKKTNKKEIKKKNKFKKCKNIH